MFASSDKCFCCSKHPLLTFVVTATQTSLALTSASCFSLFYFGIVSLDLAVFLALLVFLVVHPLRVYLSAFLRRRQRVSGLLRLVAEQMEQETGDSRYDDQELDLMTELTHTTHSSSYIASLPHLQAKISSSCCICIDAIEVGHYLTILPCTHMFHSSCVDAWLNCRAVCPLCKSSAVLEGSLGSLGQELYGLDSSR
jgi:hypothetical protein